MTNEIKIIKELFSDAPDSHLDKSMVDLIKSWDDNPTPLQLLEVIDKCIYSSLCSGFVLGIMQSVYDAELKRLNIIHEKLVPFAVWRKEE